jgi:hypothetical protein
MSDEYDPWTPGEMALAMCGRVVGDDPIVPPDWDAYFRGLARIKRAERKQRIKDDLATIKAANKAGLPVRRAIVEGTTLEFGEAEARPPRPPRPPEPPNAGGEGNEWDREYGTASAAQIRS